MSSTQDFMQYIYENIIHVGGITYKKMFGEYGIYKNGKIIALVCDNQFLLKPTNEVVNYLRDIQEVLPYKGARNAFFLIEDIEDREYIEQIIKITYEFLPEPKVKKKKN